MLARNFPRFCRLLTLPETGDMPERSMNILGLLLVMDEYSLREAQDYFEQALAMG